MEPKLISFNEALRRMSKGETVERYPCPRGYWRYLRLINGKLSSTSSGPTIDDCYVPTSSAWDECLEGLATFRVYNPKQEQSLLDITLLKFGCNEPHVRELIGILDERYMSANQPGKEEAGQVDKTGYIKALEDAIRWLQEVDLNGETLEDWLDDDVDEDFAKHSKVLLKVMRGGK